MIVSLHDKRHSISPRADTSLQDHCCPAEVKGHLDLTFYPLPPASSLLCIIFVGLHMYSVCNKLEVCAVQVQSKVHLCLSTKYLVLNTNKSQVQMHSTLRFISQW